MLNQYLRNIYKSKVVNRQMFENNLKNWKIEENSLSKTFRFEEFKTAMTFVSCATEYLQQYGINAQISNVYNKVTISIEEKSLNQLTTRELKAAVYLDEMGAVDPIEDIMKTDYTVGHHAFPERYSLDLNNLIPTDAYQTKDKFLFSGDKSHQLKLL